MKIYCNDARTVLVTVYPDGSITVATREEPDAIWGPPIKVTETR